MSLVTDWQFMNHVCYRDEISSQWDFAQRITVIIPTLNEAANLTNCLPTRSDGVEVIVADGGSSDRTIEVAIANNCRVCSSATGRAC